MARAMYVNVVNEEESRIAIVENGLLEELSVETSRDELIEGNIYKARVEKVVPGLDAVFVDYGRERNGFIALSEVRTEYFTNGERKAENLKRGRDLIVQVKKGEIGQKGAALTTFVSIPGRYLVIMPFVDKRGVSRQIEDESLRKDLRDAITETAIPEGMGYIVRTAAGDQKKQDIQRDVMFLLRLWKRISALYEKASGPTLIYREGDIVIRTIRDYFAPEMKELLIDDEKVHERVAAFFRAVMPWHAKKVKLYDGRAPLFSKHNLENQIASIYFDKVKLPSGGSIVIQQTEALVSVDVNSGSGSKMKDIEETAFKTNMEAAAEVGRQLRLRDMGGLIVIDFIDMRSQTNQNAVKKELQRVLKSDKARTDIGTISKFGLLELSRQRLRRAASPKVTGPCPTCGGSGKLFSTDTFSLQVSRVLHLTLSKGQYKKANVGVSVETASFLFNRKRTQIAQFEEMFKTSINIFAEPLLGPNQYYIDFIGEKTRYETNLASTFRTETLKCRAQDTREEDTKRKEIASYEGLEDEPLMTGIPDEVPDEPFTAQPKTPEETPETSEEEKTAEPVATEEPASDQTPHKKKRRRRRRKKKTSAEHASENAETPSTAPEAKEEEQSSEPKPETGTAPDQTKPTAKKPRRRSRRRGKKPAQAPQAGQAPAPAEPPPAAEPVGEPEQATESEATGEKKIRKRPSRRRRSRKKPGPAPTSTPSEE